REFYIQGLPAEFEKLQALLDQVRQDKPARDVISEIHQALHKFAGSGGSFGFHDLSVDARKLEQELVQWLKSGEIHFSQSEIDELTARIADLSKVLVVQDSTTQNPNEQHSVKEAKSQITLDLSTRNLSAG